MLGFSAIGQFSLTEYGTASRGKSEHVRINLHGKHDENIALNANHNETINLHGRHRETEGLDS